jgi:hypothetical protein
MANTPDWLTGLRNIGIFAAVALTMILIGTNEKIEWAIIPVTPVLCGLFGWLVTKSRNATLGWMAIGLIAGIGFYLAI